VDADVDAVKVRLMALGVCECPKIDGMLAADVDSVVG
jgi:hypothetical protein